MRRFSMIAMTLAMAVAAACGDGGGNGSAADGPTSTTGAAAATTVPATTPGSTVPATDLTLRITGARLINSEESDSGMRILLPAGVASASVTLTGLPTPNRVISVCQADDLDRRLNIAVCRVPADGEAVSVALGSAASGVEIVQVGVTDEGPEGNSALLDEINIRYGASSRELDVRLPQIAAGDSGSTPTFRLTPASGDGSYRATLTWRVIPVFGGTNSNGQLELLEGAAGATKTESGSAEVQLSGNVPTPVGDVAIRVRNEGDAALVTPTLNVVLP